MIHSASAFAALVMRASHMASVAATTTDEVATPTKPKVSEPEKLDYEYSWYLYREIMVELITKIRLSDRDIQRLVGIPRVRLNKLYASKKRSITRPEWESLLRLCKVVGCHPYVPMRKKPVSGNEVMTVKAIRAELDRQHHAKVRGEMEKGVGLLMEYIPPQESEPHKQHVMTDSSKEPAVTPDVMARYARYPSLAPPIHPVFAAALSQTDGDAEPTTERDWRITTQTMLNVLADHLVHGDEETLRRMRVMLRSGMLPPHADLSAMVDADHRDLVTVVTEYIEKSPHTY